MSDVWLLTSQFSDESTRAGGTVRLARRVGGAQPRLLRPGRELAECGGGARAGVARPGPPHLGGGGRPQEQPPVSPLRGSLPAPGAPGPGHAGAAKTYSSGFTSVDLE